MPQLPCPVSQHCAFDGEVVRWSHDSNVLDCEMHFSTYLPPAAEQGPVPVLFWLSGLTCSDENFTVKAGAQRFAAQQGLAIVAPDTSPRGSNTPGEDDAWNLGTGAGWPSKVLERRPGAPWTRQTGKNQRDGVRDRVGARSAEGQRVTGL